MNERVQELAREAQVITQFETVIPPSLIKFAELIVAECLDIVEDEDDGSVDTKSVRWAMIRIKKHFGIEE